MTSALSSAFVFSNPVGILMAFALTIFQLDWLTVSLSFFLIGLFLVLLFSVYSSVYSFYIIFCAWFYELVERAHSASFEGLALYGRVLCEDCVHLLVLAS